MKNPKVIETVIAGATYKVPTYKVTNVLQLTEVGDYEAQNVFRLCAGGVLKNESSNLVQKPIRITGVHFITDAPLAQNRC